MSIYIKYFAFVLLFAGNLMLLSAQETKKPAATKEKKETVENVSREATAGIDKPNTNQIEISYPNENEFVFVKTPVSVNLQELQKKLVYPEEGLRNKVEGKVFVRALIDKNGTPIKTKILRSDSGIFEQSAVNAVMGITYTPAKDAEDNPVSSWVTIPVTFKVK